MKSLVKEVRESSGIAACDFLHFVLKIKSLVINNGLEILPLIILSILISFHEKLTSVLWIQHAISRELIEESNHSIRREPLGSGIETGRIVRESLVPDTRCFIPAQTGIHIVAELMGKG